MRDTYSILIVDDDADDREILRDAFMAHNNRPQYVFLEDGESLLNYLYENESALPSLILMDLNMPGMDGREALKEIKTNEKLQHIPTVIFTTSSSQRDKQITYRLGANCFITKPDTFNKLMELASSISLLWLQDK
jgi:CheY-like chemotaxis protein